MTKPKDTFISQYIYKPTPASQGKPKPEQLLQLSTAEGANYPEIPDDNTANDSAIIYVNASTGEEIPPPRVPLFTPPQKQITSEMIDKYSAAKAAMDPNDPNRVCTEIPPTLLDHKPTSPTGTQNSDKLKL